MPFPHHSWPMVLVDSREADFVENQWRVAMMPDARIGAGLYLAIPVMDEDEAKIIEKVVRELRGEPTSDSAGDNNG